MEYTLSMTFLTAAGLKTNLSISGVKPTITEGQTIALMDIIIAKNIFKTNSGDLVKKSGTQLTQRQVTKYEINLYSSYSFLITEICQYFPIALPDQWLLEKFFPDLQIYLSK